MSERRLIFGGAGVAGSGTPWRTLGEITTEALASVGCSVEIDGRVYGINNPRLVASGTVDLAGGFAQRVRWAYQGVHDYAGDPPRDNLRIIAAIELPSWFAVAVRWESGIADLSDIKERRLPVRVWGGTDALSRVVLEHYGIRRADVEGWGGRFPASPPPPGYPQTSAERSLRSGDFDLIMDTVYAGNSPEAQHWLEASVLFNLRFLALPRELIERICHELGGEPGLIPVRLLRGVTQPVPSIQREPQVIYTTRDLAEDTAYEVAQALDARRRLFRLTHLPFSYDPNTAARSNGVPLHPGAARYYATVGYPTSD